MERFAFSFTAIFCNSSFRLQSFTVIRPDRTPRIHQLSTNDVIFVDTIKTLKV